LSYKETAVAGHIIKTCETAQEPAKALGCAKVFGTPVPIWTNDALLLVGIDNFPRIRGQLRDLVEDFALDYLKANERPNK
jgi:hypothetical protein